ncbi:MAG: hypothetical protein JRJ19_11525 [Deltaproteobacteria bacterium]|nr:hypothetical protein [Deltaproteobacteria bacterium]
MRIAWVVIVAALNLVACQETVETPLGYQRDCSRLVFFESSQQHQQVSVIGDFNGWNETATPLSDSNGDGVYTVRLDLQPGLYQYRLWVDGFSFLEKFNPLTLFDSEQQENSVIRVADCEIPLLELGNLEIDADGQLEMSAHFLRASSNAVLAVDSVVATLEDGTELPVSANASPGDIQIIATGIPPGKHKLQLTAKDRQQVQAEGLEVSFWVEQKAFEWNGAVVYQIAIDRFRKGGGTLDQAASISYYRGGDLKGVTETIEEGYFEGLGVNVLWLSPVYENPEGQFTGRDGHLAQAYHGYWPSKPRQVETRFGGETALQELVQAAHARGIRVIVDVVPNHVHIEHPYYAERTSDAWFNNPQGECICGFSCPWATKIEECWFDPFLPDLSFRNPEVVETVVADLIWWLEQFDLDGLRIDAVPMMPRLIVRHLRDQINRKLAVGDGQIYLLGETYTARGGQNIIRYYLGPHSLSGQFDFPVMWVVRDSLAGRTSFIELDSEVRASEAAWTGSGAVMAPILGNHDVPRFISDMNGDSLWQPRDNPPQSPTTDKPYDLLKMAWTFLMSQPGAAVIYYGDEYGMPGASDPDNRRNMRFSDELSDKEKNVLSHIGRLGRARACSQAMQRGTRRTLFVNENLYVYGRDAGDGYPAIVILNRATLPREIEMSIPKEWALAEDAVFKDLLGSQVEFNEMKIETIVLPRSSTLILSEAACLEVE